MWACMYVCACVNVMSTDTVCVKSGGRVGLGSHNKLYVKVVNWYLAGDE